VVARRGTIDDLADQPRVRDGRGRSGRVQHRARHRGAAARRPRTSRRGGCARRCAAGRAWSVGVVVTDTLRPAPGGRAQTDTAIGAAGVLPVTRPPAARRDAWGNTPRTSPWPRVGRRDRGPRATWSRARRCKLPVALVRGLSALVTEADGPGAQALVRALERGHVSGSVRPDVLPARAHGPARFTAPAGGPGPRSSGRSPPRVTAPAPHHSEPWRFVIVSSLTARLALLDAMQDAWTAEPAPRRVHRGADRPQASSAASPLRDAPLIVVPCLELSARPRVPGRAAQGAPSGTCSPSRWARRVENFLVCPGGGEPGLGVDLVRAVSARTVAADALDLPEGWHPMGRDSGRPPGRPGAPAPPRATRRRSP